MTWKFTPHNKSNQLSQEDAQRLTEFWNGLIDYLESKKAELIDPGVGLPIEVSIDGYYSHLYYDKEKLAIGVELPNGVILGRFSKE